MDPGEASRRAARYLEAHGDESQRLGAAALLGRGDAEAAVAALADSGSRPDALRERLGFCDDLRALSGPRARDWAEAARATQAPDGGWLPDAPLERRLFETGMLAGQLAKTRYARPDTLAAAGDFLALHWSPDRVRGGSWCAIAAYAHYFANADHEAADGVLQWCGRELGRAFLTRGFDAVRAARVLACCDAQGMPGAELRREDLLLALLSEQALDGSFAAWTGEGARTRTGSTWDGLVALQRLGDRA